VDAGEKLQIRKVTSAGLVRACRRYLAQDPVSNVLPLGDLYSPLFEVSDVYCAVETARVVGVCAIYRAFLKPSVVLGAAVQDVKEALAKKAIGEISVNSFHFVHPKRWICTRIIQLFCVNTSNNRW